MKQMIVFLVIGYWVLLSISDFWISLFFFCCFGIFLKLRSRHHFIVLGWICLFLLSRFVLVEPIHDKPEKGIYTIYEIKQNYCLARNEQTDIVLYGLENPNFQNQYFVQAFDEISSLHNIGLFHFESYMNEKGIYYSANIKDSDLVKESNSIRSNIYKNIRNKNSSWYLSCFYGIHEENSLTMIQSLGLPILGIIQWLRIYFQRYFSKEHVEVILLFFSLIYGHCFIYSLSLVRIIVFQLAKLIGTSWQVQWSIGCFLYLFLFPKSHLDFVFLFPVTIMFVSHFIHDSTKRSLVIRFLLFIFQFVYFHQINMLQTLFFSPLRKLYSMIVCIGFISLGLPWFTNVFILCMEFFQDILSKIPLLTWQYVPNFFFIGLSILCVFMILLEKHSKIMISLVCILPFVSFMISPFFHVYMFDIGQGDCTLIVEPFQKSVVMIDCGQNLYRDNVETIILPFLESQHIKKLDALVLTHDDYDHSGGYETLKQKIQIDQVIESRKDIPSVQYPFYSLLENRDSKDSNDLSIVNYFSYDDLSYLWTGDAGIQVEEGLLEQYELDIDILKIAHHGSKTSSSYEFLDTLQPKLALISVGENNRYQHPSLEVIERLQSLHIPILMTKDVGMIHIQSFKGISFFHTASNLFGIIE